MGKSVRKIPTFDEVMQDEPPKRKIPSYDEVMGIPVKKKVGSIDFDQSSTIPSVSEVPLSSSEDILKLANEYNKVSGRISEISKPIYTPGGGALTPKPADEDKTRLTEINKAVKDAGYDPKEIFKEFGDFPVTPNADITKLLQEKKDNPLSFERTKAAYKYQVPLFKAIREKEPELAENIISGLIAGQEASYYGRKRYLTKDIYNAIDKYIDDPDDRKKLKGQLAIDKGNIYGIDTPEKQQDIEADPRFANLNKYQIEALNFLEDTDPEKYQIFNEKVGTLDVSKQQGNESLMRGYEQKARELERMGMKLEQTALEEAMTNYYNKFKNWDIVKSNPELVKKIQTIEQSIAEDKKKLDTVESELQWLNSIYAGKVPRKEQESYEKLYNTYRGLVDKINNNSSVYNNDLNEYNSNKEIIDQEFNKYNTLHSQYETLIQDQKNQSERFPNIAALDADALAQEALGQRNGSLKRGILGVGENVGDAINWMGDILQSPFRSKEERTIDDLEDLGDKKFTQNVQRYRTAENQLLSPDYIPEFQDELKTGIEKIKSSNTDDKLGAVRNLILSNMDKVKTSKNKDAGSFNFTPNAIFNTVSDTGAEILSTIGLTATTGGFGNISKIRQLSTLFGTTFATAYNDYYTEAIEKNIKNPTTYAMVHTAIEAGSELINNDISMVKKLVNPKSTLGHIVGNITKKEWDDIAKAGTGRFGKILQVAKGVGQRGIKNAFQETGEEMAGQLGGNVADLTMFNQDVDLMDGLKSTFVNTIIGTLPLGLLGLGGELKQLNRNQKYGLYEAAQNKDKYLSQLADDVKNGIINSKKSDQIKAIIENASAKLNELSEKNTINIDQTDNEKADILADQMIEISITDEQRKEIKDQQSTEAKRNKLIEKGHNAIDKLLEEKDDKGHFVFKGVYRDVAKSDPLLFLEEVAQQAQGIDKDGNKLEGGGRELEMIPKYGADIINVAKELFPAPKPGVSVLMPGEVKQLETTTIAPKEPKKDQKAKPPVIILPKQEGSERQEFQQPVSERLSEATEINEPTQTSEESNTTTSTGTEGEGTRQEAPAISEPPTETNAAEGQPDLLRLSHADTEKIYKEHGLPLRMETPTKKDADLVAAADKLVESGYDFDAEAAKVMKGGKDSFTDEEQVAFAKMVGALKAKQEGLDIKSEEFNKLQDKIEKYSRASDVVGTLEARAFRARQVFVPKEETISDYVMREKEAAGVETLTDKQKEQVQKEHTEISEAQKAFDEKMQALRDENAKLRAQIEVKKAGKQKVQKKDFKKEQENILAKIKEKWNKPDSDEQILMALPIPGLNKLGAKAKKLIEISPDVAKLMKSYAEQGIVELSEMVKKLHTDLKPVIEDISEQDVIDLISGEYNPKKKTRNELAAKLRDIRDEAKLVKKLDEVLRGKPRTEKERIQRNQKITELREKIKDIQSFDSEVERLKKENVELKAKQKGQTEKDLSKAEKEVDKQEEKEQREKEAAEEKEMKRQQKEAEEERKKLEREFEKEQRQAEKEKLKAKVAEAKRIEKELSFRTPEEKALDAFKNRMQKQIDHIEAQIKSGDFAEPEAAPPKLDKEAIDLQNKLIQLKNERQKRLLIQEYEKSSRWNKIQTGAANILGVPRTIMASMDYSAPLRQALLPTLSHPIMASRAALEMFKSSFSQKNYDRWFDNLHNSERFKLMNDSKLAITDVNNPKLSAKEEQYMNGLAEKIPVIGRMIKGSERAYTIYLNKMRVDLFNRFADQMQKDGRTFENSPDQYKQMAAFVNNMTGRGDLGKTLNEAAPVLNQLFFSPRLMASRINTLTYLAQPRFWKKAPVEVRKDYFRSMLTTAGIGLTILGLAKLAGADTEDDPRSPDFGKIKSGNTRWDIWGGHQQYIRVAAQLISGKTKSSTSGKIYELGSDDPYSRTRGDVALSLGRGKLAPIPSLIVDIGTGKNAIGDELTTNLTSGPKQVGVGENALSHLLPLTLQPLIPIDKLGMGEALKDQGAKAWFTVGMPSVFGVGTNTYETMPTNSKADKPGKEGKKDKK